MFLKISSTVSDEASAAMWISMLMWIPGPTDTETGGATWEAMERLGGATVAGEAESSIESSAGTGPARSTVRRPFPATELPVNFHRQPA